MKRLAGLLLVSFVTAFVVGFLLSQVALKAIELLMAFTL